MSLRLIATVQIRCCEVEDCHNTYYANGLCLKCRNKLYLVRNKEKIQGYRREYYKKNKAKIDAYRERTREVRKKQKRERNLYKNYGITMSDYDNMYMAQSGCCIVCGKNESEVGKLVVEHNHTTKVVRGLACHRCNTAFGLMKEDPERCRKLTLYAEKHKGAA